MLHLAAQTGLRASELTALRRRDVHLGAGPHVRPMSPRIALRSWMGGFRLSRRIAWRGSFSTTLVIPPFRSAGPVLLKLRKDLAAQDLVYVTAEMREPTRATARLTVSASFLDELGYAPRSGLAMESVVASRRRKADWFVEVTQAGQDLVGAAMEPS